MQSCRAQPERGGILIGRQRGPHLEITDYTEPGAMDASALYSFTKSDPKHGLAAKAAGRQSGGTDTYLGEWHTHPQGNPVPSDIDRGTWKTVSKQQGAMMAFVIVSPTAWGVYAIDGQDFVLWRRVESAEINGQGCVFAPPFKIDYSKSKLY